MPFVSCIHRYKVSAVNLFPHSKWRYRTMTGCGKDTKSAFHPRRRAQCLAGLVRSCTANYPNLSSKGFPGERRRMQASKRGPLSPRVVEAFGIVRAGSHPHLGPPKLRHSVVPVVCWSRSDQSSYTVTCQLTSREMTAGILATQLGGLSCGVRGSHTGL